jgi:hypothetical protein
VALALLCVLGASLSVLPGGRAVYRAVYRAALLLPAVITTSRTAPLVASAGSVSHTQLTLSSQGGAVFWDVYAPTDPVLVVPGAREGVIIIPGVGDNRPVPDLINLSTALARAGFVLMELTTPTLLADNPRRWTPTAWCRQCCGWPHGRALDAIASVSWA